MFKFFNNLKIKSQMIITLGLMALLCISVGAIGLVSMLHYNELAFRMENASSRAVIGEQVNSTVLSVVMDSRGIYMAVTPEDVEKYGVPLLKSLDKIQMQMMDWEKLLPDDRKSELQPVTEKVDEFVKYRAEIVRLARQVSIADGRAWGDNDANRANRKKLNDEIVAMANHNNEEVSHSLEAMQKFFVEQRTLLIGTLAVFIPLFVLGMLFLTLRFIVAPIRKMTNAMDVISKGDLEVQVPGLDAKNEIGDMAVAVEVFRTNLIATEKMNEQEKVRHIANEKRVETMSALIRDFDYKIEEALNVMNAASTELEATAQAMSATAEESSRTATSVAAASEEAMVNVESVAHASETMSSSIQDIIREVSISRDATDKAAIEAKQTSVIAEGLIDATRKIDDVVRIIQDIAGQTNLLALNATIEAARAGDMGKGFAVVANEVKNLATQTAASTEQIAEQVGAVQQVSTQMVAAINGICDTIERINRMSESVTGTMVNQGTITSEILASIIEASKGTREVTLNISNVSEGARETGNAASELLSAASEIAQQSASMRSQIGSFLHEIKQL